MIAKRFTENLGEKLGRFLFTMGWLIFASLFTWEAYAKNISVFNIRKDLPLNSKEAPQKDYYLNGGTFDGLKIGSVLTIVRRLPMHDSSTNRPYGDLHLAVAQLKVVYAEKNVSVARLVKVLNGKDRPLVDYLTVMIGDSVESSDGYGTEERGEEKPTEKATEKLPEKSAMLEVSREPDQRETSKESSTEKADFSSKSQVKEVEKPEEPKTRGPSSSKIRAGPLT